MNWGGTNLSDCTILTLFKKGNHLVNYILQLSIWPTRKQRKGRLVYKKSRCTTINVFQVPELFYHIVIVILSRMEK